MSRRAVRGLGNQSISRLLLHAGADFRGDAISLLTLKEDVVFPKEWTHNARPSLSLEWRARDAMILNYRVRCVARMSAEGIVEG